MSSFPFNVPAGLPISQVLSFNPTAVIVSNFSPYYIYFPDGLTYCPPWTNGAVLPLGHATQARASWTNSPFGEQVVNPATALWYSAQLAFSDDENLSIAGGSAINNPYNAAQITSQSFNLAQGTYNYIPPTIPPGSVIKGVAISGVVSGGTLGTVTVDISDGTDSVQVAGLMVPVYGAHLDKVYPDLVLASLDDQVASWTPYITCTDVTGVCTFHIQTSVLYG